MSIDQPSRPHHRHDRDVPPQPEHLPLWKQATTDVIAIVVQLEIDVLPGRPIDKDRALLALAARQEIADRMRRHRWLAAETARSAGATWAEVDRALGLRDGQARREYLRTLAGQKQLGLASADRHDPGPSLGPQL